MGSAALNVPGVKIQILNFYIYRVYELGEWFSSYLPVDQLRYSISDDDRADQECRKVILFVGEVDEGKCESNDFKYSEIYEVDKVITCIRLFFIELKPEHSHLNDQNNRIDALSSSSLEQVLIPKWNGITIGCQVVSE